MPDPFEINVYKPDPLRKPTLEDVRSTTLRSGKRVRRTATLFGIRNQRTGERHHDALRIETFERKGEEWLGPEEKRSVSLDGEDIDRLIDFLRANREGAVPNASGGYVVLQTTSGSAETLRQLRDLAQPDKIDALALLLRETGENLEAMAALVARLSKDTDHLEKAAAAINLAIYRQALQQLEVLIALENCKEIDLQRLLTKHPWMFGSEYSSILKRRNWTRDQQHDFVPRRTADGYIELVEIKTPLNGRNLFNPDSRGYYYASVPLSQVLGQTQLYLEKLDQARDQILANDGEDTAKMRAKIIIGRDNGEEQTAALRRHNGHLHRIEIMTFDGLLATARRVVRCLEEPLTPAAQPPSFSHDLDDDIPF